MRGEYKGLHHTMLIPLILHTIGLQIFPEGYVYMIFDFKSVYMPVYTGMPSALCQVRYKSCGKHWHTDLIFMIQLNIY